MLVDPAAIEEKSLAIIEAAVIKDAGDDPDVTHGAKICATVAGAERARGARRDLGPRRVVRSFRAFPTRWRISTPSCAGR